MAKKKKKAKPLSKRQRRRLRLKQIAFTVFAVVVIASFVFSLFA